MLSGIILIEYNAGSIRILEALFRLKGLAQGVGGNDPCLEILQQFI